MAPLVFVEVLGRHDRVSHRQAIEVLPCSVGRAYDNDVILDDPFVQAHHACIDRDDDGALTWSDLVSGTRTRIDAKVGASCAIGRTRVRLRTPGFVLEQTSVEPFQDTRFGRLVGSRSMRGLGMAMGVLCVAATMRWDSYGSDVSDWVGPALVMIVVLGLWSSTWALAGRLRSHHGTFGMHFALALAAVGPYVVVDGFVVMVQAIRPSVVVYETLSFLLPTSVFFAEVVGHALIIGAPTLRRAVVIGAGASSALLAGVLVAHFAFEAAFSPGLEIDARLVPLPASVIVAESPDAFLAATERIRARLDADLDPQ
jgi:pSer/pThr/pTyr-binding forkhead associated (FHA) protein